VFHRFRIPVLALAAAFAAAPALASSHMDAPLITLDDAANTTDVYAFITQRDGVKYLQTALAVYPFEEPGIGPNKFNFDDDVRYEIHVAVGSDLGKGRASLTYQFDFDTTVKNKATILQSYTNVVQNVDDGAQNLTQKYTVRKIDQRSKARSRFLGTGVVPPNNQGNATPFYNQGDDGEMPAKDGVSTPAGLDRYTAQSISALNFGYRSFAGQRDDGFYADIQSVFDLLSLRSGDDKFDSQGGFNVHTIALEIPLSELGGDQQVVGVYATTSRKKTTMLRSTRNLLQDEYVQVGRQGNPLFCEGLVAIADKDRYNRTSPASDAKTFAKYAENPELAVLINAIVFGGTKNAIETGRTDLRGIFIPDLIKVDLSTGPARLAGGGADHPTNPDDDGFHRLGIFKGDVLTSTVQTGFFGNGTLPGGWPNGRRFGDDVLDIAVSAILSDLRDPMNPVVNVADGIDNVSANDIAYNKVFPYAATPLNGRRHGHH
jgi:hypothetical protein